MTNLKKMSRELKELADKKGSGSIPNSFDILEGFVHGEISYRNAVIKLAKEKPRFWELQKIIIEGIMAPPDSPVEWKIENREYLKAIFGELEAEQDNK